MSDEILTQLVAVVQGVAASLAGLESRFERLESRLERVESRLERLESRLEGIESRLERVETRLEGVESRLVRVESRLERVDSRLERLESAHISVRTEVMARLDRFQATLDEVKHDVAASFHANERIERIARSSNEETRALADQVTALQRQVMHLNGRVTTLESRG